MKYTAIPTWLMTRIVQRWLPSTHAWYRRKFTLAEWARGRTTDCKIFDLLFWFQLVLVADFIHVHYFN